ncbi:MAG TPA: SDR family NAD(P)-dependent oxidoreductase [Methyloceanibacter sp.]|nr:SDR family NAD(P)-dependent oxidoreductase [Methyloceanibacter sp.]
MDLGLNNKLALVTGSSGGIGLAIARSLAAKGAKVAVNGRTKQSVEKAVATIRAPRAPRAWRHSCRTCFPACPSPKPKSASSPRTAPPRSSAA